MIIGPLQVESSQHALKALGSPPDVAGLLAAPTRPGGAALVAMIRIQALLQEPCRHAQRPASQGRLHRLQVQFLNGAGAQQGLELLLYLGDQPLRQGRVFLSGRKTRRATPPARHQRLRIPRSRMAKTVPRGETDTCRPPEDVGTGSGRRHITRDGAMTLPQKRQEFPQNLA